MSLPFYRFKKKSLILTCKETPLDFMSIYDKHPELIDDVNDLLGKIINAETNVPPLSESNIEKLL